MKVFYVALAGLYAVSFAFYLWGKEHKVQFNYPSRTLYPVFGLDVSHHQGEINWSEVNSEKFKFVYIKATEGEGFQDKRFSFNYEEAKKSGLKVGAYHFWSFCKDPKKQILNILNTVPRAQGDLVPALDMETVKKCDYQSVDEEKEVIKKHILLALNELSFQYGRPPIIYTTMDFLTQHQELLDFNTSYWVRSLVGPPFLNQLEWSIWQYHNAGTIDGVEGPVDLNVMKEVSDLKLIVQP